MTTYLTGKRFKYLGLKGNSAGTKTGVIVSEPFTEHKKYGVMSTVAILWEDGTMEGAIDVELLKIDVEDSGYVVVVKDGSSQNREYVDAIYIKFSSLKEAQKRAELLTRNGSTTICRIAKLNFIGETE